MADDDGIGIAADPKTTFLPLVGKSKRFMQLDVQEWIFLGLSFVNISMTVGLTIDRIATIINDDKSHTELTFAILLLFNAVCCLFYAFHGVMREREYEIYVYITAIIILFCYVVVNITLSQSTIKWVRFGLLFGFGIPNVYFGYKIGMDFGYLEFKTVGASIDVQLMFRKACRFSGLIKFTVQVAVSLLILGILNPKNLSNEEIISISVGVPFVLLWAFIGWIAMRKETKCLCWVFVVLALVEPAYIVYKIIYIVEKWDSLYESKESSPRWLAYSFFGGVGVAAIVHACLLISLKFVMDNFGKGLPERVFSVNSEVPNELARKRETVEGCGIICCGPLG